MWRVLAEPDGIMALPGNYKMNRDYLFSWAPFHRVSLPFSFHSRPAFVPFRSAFLSLSLLSLLFLAHPVPRRVFASLLRFRTNRDQLALLAPISALDILLDCPPLRASHRERAQIPLFPRLSRRRSRFSTMI